jgi:hypothetical protein
MGRKKEKKIKEKKRRRRKLPKRFYLNTTRRLTLQHMTPNALN